MTQSLTLVAVGVRVPWWVYLIALIAMLAVIAGVLLFVRPPMDRGPGVRSAPGTARRQQPPPAAPGTLPTRPRHAATPFTSPDRLLGRRYLRPGPPPHSHARPKPMAAPSAEPGQTVR